MTKLISRLPRAILVIIILGFLLRIAFLFIFTDLSNENYWEFGEIAKNLIAGKGYSLFYFDNGCLSYHFMNNANPLPSAYMPPLYVFYLVPFIIINDIILRNILLLTSHSLLSCLTIYFLFKAIEKEFSYNIALIASIIYAVLPEFIYASNTVGTTTLYHTFIAFILYYITKNNFISEFNFKKCLFLGFIFALLVYLRQEVSLFFVFLAIYYLIKKKFKTIVVVSLTTIVILSPWFVRNFCIFNEFIPFATSNGLNFFRANNPYRLGFWSDSKIEEAKYTIVPDFRYESKLNEVSFNRTIELIEQNPNFLIPRAFDKIKSFFLYYSYDERTTNLAYLIPWLSLLALSIIGIIKSLSFKKHYFLYLFLIYHLVIAMVFFTLPRYQTMYKIALLPFAALTIDFIVTKLKSKN